MTQEKLVWFLYVPVVCLCLLHILRNIGWPPRTLAMQRPPEVASSSGFWEPNELQTRCVEIRWDAWCHLVPYESIIIHMIWACGFIHIYTHTISPILTPALSTLLEGIWCILVQDNEGYPGIHSVQCSFDELMGNPRHPTISLHTRIQTAPRSRRRDSHKITHLGERRNWILHDPCDPKKVTFHKPQDGKLFSFQAWCPCTAWLLGRSRWQIESDWHCAW